jgi:hypothetical protein
MAAVRIITTPYPDQTQRVELDGVLYTFRFLWNARGQAWHFNLGDGDGAAILNGVRMVTSFPLLYRYHYLAVPPGELYLFDLRDMHGVPTLEEMGERYRFYYVDAGGFP